MDCCCCHSSIVVCHVADGNMTPASCVNGGEGRGVILLTCLFKTVCVDGLVRWHRHIVVTIVVYSGGWEQLNNGCWRWWWLVVVVMQWRWVATWSWRVKMLQWGGWKGRAWMWLREKFRSSKITKFRHSTCCMIDAHTCINSSVAWTIICDMHGAFIWRSNYGGSDAMSITLPHDHDVPQVCDFPDVKLVCWFR